MSVTRMCVGCRNRSTTDSLIRVVCEDLQVIVDRNRTHGGRGAYVHCNLECVQSAAIRKALPRALRVSALLDLQALIAYVTQEGEVINR